MSDHYPDKWEFRSCVIKATPPDYEHVEVVAENRFYEVEFTVKGWSLEDALLNAAECVMNFEDKEEERQTQDIKWRGKAAMMEREAEIPQAEFDTEV